MTKKAMIAMSGGVDSSVAAYLTRQAGYDCAGATMQLASCTLNEAADARAVAEKMQMPHYVFDFTENFRTAVIDKFAEGYAQGHTPNPCIDCNRRLKFDQLLQSAQKLGYDHIATGHYARIEYDAASQRWLLKKAMDGIWKLKVLSR